MRRSCCRAAAIIVLATAASVHATEMDNSHADLGYIDTLAGIPLAPGFYLRDDVAIFTAGRVNDQNGKQVNLNLGSLGKYGAQFRSSSEANVFEAAYVPDYRLPILDASIGMAAYEFVANSRVGLTTAIGEPEARGASKAGFSDITIVPVFLGFDVPNTDFHIMLSPLEFTAPIGRYDKNDQVGNNIGLNYWSFRPAIAMTYLNKTGQEFSLNVGTSINSQNQATHYKSGDEFYFTYAMQQYFSPVYAFGIGGYYYKQVTNDRQNGVVVNSNANAFPYDPLNGGIGNRGEAFAIGPIVSFNYSQNLVFQAHWDHDVFTYDRPQRDEIYLRASLRF